MTAEAIEKEQVYFGVTEVLCSVYDSILARYPHIELNFKDRLPLSEICEGGDYDNARKGFFRYNRVNVVAINGKDWIFALSTSTTSHAYHLASDLKAFRMELPRFIDNEILERISRAIFQRDYFKDSVLSGSSSNELLGFSFSRLSYATSDVVFGENPNVDFVGKLLASNLPPMTFTMSLGEPYEAFTKTGIGASRRNFEGYTENAKDLLTRAVTTVLERSK